VAKQALQEAQVHAIFKQERCARMTQHVAQSR
jgi:hypothetical protein